MYQQQAQPAPDLTAPIQEQNRIYLAHGMMPQLPFIPQLHPQLIQYTAQLMHTAISVIQGESTVNDLRRIFFNRISTNQYANQFFAEYATNLAAYFELEAFARRNVDPSVLIQDVVARYTQYKVCQMAMMDQGIANFVSSNIVDACRAGMMQFENSAAQLEQQARFGGQQQQPQGWQTQAQPMRQVQPWQMPGGTGSPSRYNQVGQTSAPDWARAHVATQAPPPPPPAPPQNWRQVSGGEETRVSPIIARVSMLDGSQPQLVADTPKPSPAPAPVAAEPQPQKSEEPDLSLAYDPNLYEVAVSSTGKKILVEKNVDRAKHLIKPRATPKWVRVTTIENSDERQAELSALNKSIEIVSSEEEQTVVPCLRLEEIWAGLQTSAACSANLTDIIVNEGAALEVKAMPASEAGRSLVSKLSEIDDLARAASLTKDYLMASRGADLVLMAEINQRFTERVNLVLNGQMGINTTITDFSEDFEDLIKHLTKNYGQKFVDMFLAQSVQIVRAATSVYEHQVEAIWESLYPTVPEKSIAECVLLAATTALYSINMTSADLRLELTPGEAFSMVRESAAPLAHKVISKIMERQLANACRTVMLRTVDDVRYRMCFGAFNKTALMINVFK